MQAFSLLEATISDTMTAYVTGQLSVRQVVQLYLDRIDAYDQRGPSINSIITVRSEALDEAQQLDEAWRTSGPLGPLHGIPVIVKDQIDLEGTATTLGSVLFREYRPKRDAFIVKELKRAGAIIVAKSTLAEMASGDTHGSLFGSTRNPYALQLTPGGSSGGTAASIAANFGMVGIGQESYASLRRPAAWCCLAGMRASPGLISRSGTFGGWPSRMGSPGPMTRSVADLAVLLDAMVGYDGEDPLTAYGYGHIPSTYTAYLDENGLDGARVGVLRQPMGVESQPGGADFAAVGAAFDASVAELTACGATVVDPLVIPNLTELLATRVGDLTPDESEQSWRLYFRRGANAPFATPTEFQRSPEYEKVVTRHGVWSQGQSRDVYLRARDELMTTILKLMADHRLDAIVYKSVEHQPQAVSAGVTRAAGYVDGRGSTHLNTFLVEVPAITVPAVPTAAGLPTGITFQGRPYDDGTCIKLAYAYERATLHRSPPSSTPPLPGEP